MNQNHSGFYNYREMLIHTFGEDKGDKYFRMDRRQLENETDAGRSASHRFTMPEAISGPINNRMGEIGTQLIMKNRNYEDALKMAMGPSGDNLVNLEQITQALNSCEVFLTANLRNVL